VVSREVRIVSLSLRTEDKGMLTRNSSSGSQNPRLDGDLPLLPFNARPKPRFQIVMSCLKPPTEKYYRQFHEICDARCATYRLVGYTG